MPAQRLKFQRPIVLTGHSAAVYALCEWETGFLSGDGEGLIVNWQHQKSEEGSVLAQIPDRVFCLQPLDDKQLVVGTLSGDMFWLDLKKPKDLPKRWRFHTDGLFGLLHHKEHLFATGGGGKLSRWNVSTGEMEQSNQLDTVRLRSIAYLEAAQCLAVGTGNGDIHLVDPDALRIIDTITQAHALTVFAMVDVGAYFISAGRDGQLRTWSSTSPFRQLEHVAAHASTINGLAFRQNMNKEPLSRFLASVGRDREARIWQIGQDETTSNLVLAKALTASRDGGHPSSVNCSIWLEDVLVTGGDDRTVRVWPLV